MLEPYIYIILEKKHGFNDKNQATNQVGHGEPPSQKLFKYIMDISIKLILHIYSLPLILLYIDRLSYNKPNYTIY